jgi:DNA sulfur modification protein DndE
MTWKVFGGAYEEVYLALLRQRCMQDGLGTSEEVLSVQFRLHLHRGIGYLAAEKRLKTVAELMRSAEPT